MKKWSIGLIVVSALALTAAFLLPAAASAAPDPYNPYCPAGEEGTPPYCHKPPTPPPTTCPAGQVGTYPNCVTPALKITKKKTAGITAKIWVQVNAPGKLKAYGKALIATKVWTVSAGGYKINIHLKKKKRKTLKKKGKLTVWAKVYYNPNGASAITKNVKLVFHHGKKKKKS